MCIYSGQFLDFVNSLTEYELQKIGRSELDVYYDGQHFFTYPSRTRPDIGMCIFDSDAGDSTFDAKLALHDKAETVDDEISAWMEERSKC